MIKVKESEVEKYTSGDQVHWIYNGLDNCIQRELADKLLPLPPNRQSTYDFEMSCCAPALEMCFRGLLVSQPIRLKLVNIFEKRAIKLRRVWEKLASAITGEPETFNKEPSHKVLGRIFYDTMRIPERKKFSNGKYIRTTNREALEFIAVTELYASTLANTTLSIRDVSGKLAVLRTSIDKDSRMRFSINVGATETGRWSISKNPWGSGTSGQNITNELREIFVADPGFKLAYPDLEQAESRAVAYISQDEAYIRACETGDLHITVCKMVWPNLNWSEDDFEHNKKVAKQIFYRQWSYRDLGKRGGHLTNYYGQPRTMASALHIPIKIAEEFQYIYSSAFPGIPAWHKTVATTINAGKPITTALGRVRHFFGRRFDDKTLREAIAYEPQSLVGDILNCGLLAVWRNHSDYIQCLSQLHDAILVQFPEESEIRAIRDLTASLTIPIKIHSSSLSIPVEVATGWNWAKQTKYNPDGIKTWNGYDSRQRTEEASIDLLDIRLYGAHGRD